MKKILFILMVFLVLSSCKKKSKFYQEDLQGTWDVYKYLLYNFDKSNQFEMQYPGYSISFTSDGKFTESYAISSGSTDTTRTTGTYSFTDNDEKLALDYSYLTTVIDTAGDTAYVPHSFIRKYTIFNLTKTHVELKNDSTHLYMSKTQ